MKSVDEIIARISLIKAQTSTEKGKLAYYVSQAYNNDLDSVYRNARNIIDISGINNNAIIKQLLGPASILSLLFKPDVAKEFMTTPADETRRYYHKLFDDLLK